MSVSNFSGSIVIGCQGNQKAESVETPYGTKRQRSGAELKFVRADAEAIFSKWTEQESAGENAHCILINPTTSELDGAIAKVSKALELNDTPRTGIDFYFAGHGDENGGAWVLQDGLYTAERLKGNLQKNLTLGHETRRIGFILDSCYSGAFLIDFLKLIEPVEELYVDDAFAACLHNEKSWELSFLGHGAFTYTFLNNGNSHVGPDDLTRAIQNQDHKVLARCLQGLVGMKSNPTTFLTQGKQHPINLLKGQLLTVRGYCEISIFDEDTDQIIDVDEIKQQLIDGVDRFQS
jgi:hypothetical protein